VNQRKSHPPREEPRPADPSEKELTVIPATVVEPANTDLEGLKILNLVVSSLHLWLGKVMSEAVDCNDSALAHYNRMVVTIKVDEEEELIQRSKDALEQGQTLASIWHQINS